MDWRQLVQFALLGSSDLDRTTQHTVSTMEFKNGKVVDETQYFADPFDLPASRAQ